MLAALAAPAEDSSKMAIVELTEAQKQWVIANAAKGTPATMADLSAEIFKVQGSPTAAVAFETVTIASNTIEPPRTGKITYVKLAVSGSSDTLDTVTLTNYNDGDIIIFVLADASKPVKFEGGTGNITNMYGDFTMNKAEHAASYIVSGSTIGQLYGVTDFSDPCNIRCFRAVIASADVLTLNSSPIDLVAAPGAGFAIDLIHASAFLDFNTTAYTTNTTLSIVFPSHTGTAYTGQLLFYLAATSDHIARFLLFDDYSASNPYTFENEALRLKEITGNPAAGDSPITIFGAYRIIKL